MSLPPSSPRLPSPPPAAEIQIGPKSPLMGPNAARQAAQIEQTALDTNAKRRIHPGTKSADMAAGPPLVPLHELDSAFQLQEHLAALHYYHTASHTSPITRESAKLLATPPPGIDKTLWLYELCRFLIAQCNSLIVGFLFDSPPCSAATCPEMRASEWQFLCAVHDSPKSCCAIDYCCHTLDWAANVVTNPKIFPSRFVVDAHDKNTAVKNLVNVFRRLHRIFAHAWFQHRGVFWAVESQTGLYVFFKTVCDYFDLLPAENYKLPPEAEGLDSSSALTNHGDGNDRRQQQQQLLPPISIAKPPSQRDTDDDNYSAMSRSNTRRHIKSSPSTGSAVTTVPEADEDDDAHLSNRLGRMRLATPATATPVGDDELELASIPVMVEHRPPASGERPLRPSSVIPPPGMTASDFEAEAKQGPESEPTKQEAEAAAPEPDQAPEQESEPETEYALEPEAMPEPQAETQPQAEEETPSPVPAEDQQQPEEQQTAADEPAPAKDVVMEGVETENDQEDASDVTAIHEEDAADNDSSPPQPPLTDDSSAVAANDEKAETDAKTPAEEVESGASSAPANLEEKESSPNSIPEAQATGVANQAEGEQKEEEEDKERENEADKAPDVSQGPSSSPSESQANGDAEADEKEEEKKEGAEKPNEEVEGEGEKKPTEKKEEGEKAAEEKKAD